MGKKIGDFTFVTGWDPKKHAAVLLKKTIGGHVYNQILLRSGISLPERRKIAKDLRLNYGYSVRLIKINQHYEIFVSRPGTWHMR